MSILSPSSTPSYNSLVVLGQVTTTPPNSISTYVPNTIRGLVRLWLGDTNNICFNRTDVDIDALLYLNGYTGDPGVMFNTFIRPSIDPQTGISIQGPGLVNGLSIQSAIFLAVAHGLQQEAILLSRGANVMKSGTFSFDYREQYKAIRIQIKEMYRMANEESNIVVDLSTHFVPYYREQVPSGDW